MKASSVLRITPITRALVAGLIACGLVGADITWPGQLRSVVDELKLPAELANYKDWGTLLQSPAPVPVELWILCIAPTPTEWAQAREKYGPHTEHYIQVYGNQIATQTLRQGKAGLFPTGAVFAKEKLMGSPQGTVAGVAFMIKRGASQFTSSGGWEFAYYPRFGESASIQACATCHRSAGSTDYVFGQYPSSGDPLRPTQTHSR
jgi:Cytochrome P460